MEDYKEKYENLLLDIDIAIAGQYEGETKIVLQNIKERNTESEDERIRKELIRAFTVTADKRGHEIYGNGITYGQVLTWLEKQGKNNMGVSETTKRKLEDNLHKALEKETPESCNKFLDEQGEQKPTNKVEPKFKVGDIVINKKSKDTVKIEQILHDSYRYSGWDGAATVHSDFSIFEQDNWELVEHKHTWSEEDEQMLQKIIQYVISLSEECEVDLNDKINWLKSLKERMKGE